MNREYSSILASLLIHILIAFILSHFETDEHSRDRITIEIQDSQDASKSKTLAPKIKNRSESRADNNKDIRFYADKKSRTLKETVQEPSINLSPGQEKVFEPKGPTLNDLIPETLGRHGVPSVDLQQTENLIIDDHLSRGSFTSLNTDRLRFYGYYTRLNSRIGSHWIPRIEDAIYKLYLSDFDFQRQAEFITTVIVKLDREGSFNDLIIVNSSGIDSIDASIESTFRAVTPLPNPPEALIQEDGKVHLHYRFKVIAHTRR